MYFYTIRNTQDVELVAALNSLLERYLGMSSADASLLSKTLLNKVASPNDFLNEIKILKEQSAN